jgi:4-hydroxyphenylacetate 3-monooxygenase
MTLRTGADYRTALADKRVVQIGEDRPRCVAEHPAFSGIVESVAGFYERRNDPEVGPLLVARADDGTSYSRAFKIPRSLDELRELGRMIEAVARLSGGTAGRMPDYVPLVLAGLVDAAPLLAADHPEWAENIVRYHGDCRAGDLFLAHSFADRQFNRSLPSGELPHLSYRAADGGDIVVSGIKAVATSAPIADEFLVLTPPRAGLSAGQALFLSVPVATPGLRFVCRPSLAGTSAADHPLSARFDEMDCWAVFEDVRIPAGRQFLVGDIALVRRSWRNLLAWAYYHILIRLAVKAELFLGTTSLIARYLGVDGFEETRVRIADLARHVETLRAFVAAAEAGSRPTPSGAVVPDGHCLAVGHMYAVEHHHRLRDSLIAIAGQSILMAPLALSDGDGAALIPGGGDEDEVRRRIFRLGWDLAASGFAGRQYLFEQFNGRDLTRNRQVFLERYDLEACQSLARRIALGE